MNSSQNFPQPPSNAGQFCLDCSETATPTNGRREFIRVLTDGAMGLAGASSLLSPTPVQAASAATSAAKPAESLVRELFSTLTAGQVETQQPLSAALFT